MRTLATIAATATLAIGLGFSQTAQALDLADGLVGYWPFDDQIDPSEDASVNSNDAGLGTTSGAADASDPTFSTTDIAPTAGNVASLDFDGGDDSATVPNAAALDVTSAYTVSVWLRSDDVALTNVFRPILVRGANDGAANVNDIEIYIQANTQHLIVAHNRDNMGSIDFVGFVDPPLGSLFHLAVVYDGTDAQAFYDGVPVAVAQRDTTLVNADTAGKDWLIGLVDHRDFNTFGTGRMHHFDGILDEVRIYDRALSDQEVEVLASGAALPDPFADMAESFTPPTDCKTPLADPMINDCDIFGDDLDGGDDAVDAPENDSGDNTTFTSLGYTTDSDGDALNGPQPEGGEVILKFTDNTCLDGPDPDFTVYEVGVAEAYSVAVGGGSGTSAGSASGEADFNAPLPAFNRVTITATNGTFTNPTGGPDIDAVECLNSLALGPDHIEKEIVGDNDIDVGVDNIQNFSFDITITNAGGDDLSDLLFVDVVPAEFDVTGAVSDSADCLVSFMEHQNSGSSEKPKLRPDIVTIDNVILEAGESCTVSVDVATDDDHPGGGNSPDFTPASCPSGTIVLNDGVQVLDDNGTPEEDDDVVLFVDDDTLELTCN